MTRPLYYEDGAPMVLDQRALPEQERWLACTAVEQVAEAIETLAVRGAPAIGVAAAYGAAIAPAEESSERSGGCGGRARRRSTCSGRSTGCARRGRSARLETAHAIARREERATRLIAGHGSALLTEPARVITHCNTGALAATGVGTALGVVCAAFAAGRVREVWVPETRPLLQGARLTAWELAQEGIPHRVVTDSSVGLLLFRGLVDAAVVGADRIAANGDVANKIGTYPLAALAARHGVPFYVAAPVSTIDPRVPTGADIPIEERAPGELATPGGAPAANWAFDVPPHELVSAIITERGVLRPPYSF